MTPTTQMRQFLEQLKTAQGETRQMLVSANKRLLRTELAQKSVTATVALFKQRVARLEQALRFVRAQQEVVGDGEVGS